MKILSLNVNQFAGNENIADTANIDSLNSYSKEVIALIKGFLLGNDKGIAILQEVPCWNYENKKYRLLYDCFVKEFPDDRYKLIPPPSVKGNIVTLAISNNGHDWNNCDGFAKQVTDFKNRFVEVINDDGTHILGVHMPIDKKNEKCNVAFWQELKKYSEEKKGDNFFIVGDFNAYVGQCDYSEPFKNILDNDYFDCLAETAITYYYNGQPKTKIDHVLTTQIAVKTKAFAVKMPYSDHAVVITSEVGKVDLT